MFPMNQQAEDLLMGAPSKIDGAQLKDLHPRRRAAERAEIRRVAPWPARR